ncbi:MAG TPA: cation transporter [Saprospiraceae bacterium]|nr:cation transporter [Saprospiraceae bacterium]
MGEHHHDHDHGIKSLEHISRAFYIGIVLNLAFTVVEFVMGYMSNSLALVADASHNLSDVASLVISLIGLKLTQKAATAVYTYGYKKASILASLVNSVILIAVVINIFVEGFQRLSHPPEVVGRAIIITALVGVVINTISAWLFFKDQKEDINVKGAYLHLMLDAVISIGVVISGVIIYYTGWVIVDPLISFVVGVVILVSTWGLLKESLKLTLDGVPKDIQIDEIKQLIADNQEIREVYHIHIWALSSTENALTAHVSLQQDNLSGKELMSIKNKLKHQLKHHNIHHATIELDGGMGEDALGDCC